MKQLPTTTPRTIQVVMTYDEADDIYRDLGGRWNRSEPLKELLAIISEKGNPEAHDAMIVCNCGRQFWVANLDDFHVTCGCGEDLGPMV